MENATSIVDEIIHSVRRRLSEARPIVATYRLQFQQSQFRFPDAAAVADYLGQLGISHVYSSPTLKARSGSTHGYDVVEHSRVNDELGTDSDFKAYVEALHQHGLGQILDVVPNHVSVATDENLWWMDVLQNGPSSPYAGYFDIAWHPVKQELQGRVLLPILGDLYGKLLEEGKMTVLHQDGGFFVNVNESHLPLDPQTWGAVLTPHLDELTQSAGESSPDVLELRSIVTALQYLPSRNETAAERTAERHRERIVIQGRLARLMESSAVIAAHVEHNLKELNGTVGQPETFNALDRLLDDQAFRLVHWKAGSDEMNYRRFFDVTELAALCMERLDVFEATHHKLYELLVDGSADGFRIDHIDGLYDPGQYLWRLQWGWLRALGQAAHAEISSRYPDLPSWTALESSFFDALYPQVGGSHPRNFFGPVSPTPVDGAPMHYPGNDRPPTERPPFRPLYVVVEKILGPDEPLPAEWPIEGTTGYYFLNVINGLFVDPAGLRQLEKHYAKYLDEDVDFHEIVYDCKRLILSGPMQSEVQLLAHRLDRLSNRHRLSRDYTLQALRAVLREIMACFPVYRTYLVDGCVTDRDRSVVQRAIAHARRRNPVADASVFQFVRDVLFFEQPANLDAEGKLQRDLFVGRFQQVTGPVMAKGVEDTAFYRYLPLTSLEEVGGEPAQAVRSVADLHEQNAGRREHWPQALLASTTHDTKRTEDVRARITILSEIPDRWRTVVQKWTRTNRKHVREVDGEPAPSRNDEWLVYQTLVGMWPLTPPDDAQRQNLIERLQAYMRKAIHEAKVRTSWINPNAAYDDAVDQFVAGILSDRNPKFLKDLQEFHESIVNLGLWTSISQVLIKLTAPGIPDIYQGQEIWDFSLVDPDNRRPVDYARRRQLLDAIHQHTATPEGRLELARSLAANPRDDRTKLFVTWSALQLRKAWGADILSAAYTPLAVDGPKAGHVIAYARTRTAQDDRPESAAILVVPRLLHGLHAKPAQQLPLEPAEWGETAVNLQQFAGKQLRNLLTGRTISSHNGRLSLSEALQDFPAGLFVTE